MLYLPLDSKGLTKVISSIGFKGLTKVISSIGFKGADKG